MNHHESPSGAEKKLSAKETDINLSMKEWVDQMKEPEEFLKEHDMEDGGRYFATKDGQKLILEIAPDEIVVYREDGEWAAAINRTNGYVSLDRNRWERRKEEAA